MKLAPQTGLTSDTAYAVKTQIKGPHKIQMISDYDGSINLKTCYFQLLRLCKYNGK